MLWAGCDLYEAKGLSFSWTSPAQAEFVGF